MNRKLFISITVLTLLLLSSFILFAAQPTQIQNSSQMKRKIVLFQKNILNEPAREALIRKFGGVKIKDLNLINGMAVLLPPQAEAPLAKQAGVLKLEDDLEVETLAPVKLTAKKAPPQPPETLPWGVDRIDADLAWSTSRGTAIKVGVLDTGIDLTHPDLSERIKGSYNAINPLRSANDDNGHGTHVAGIIAATDNEIGVIGTAPEADLFAIKVLNRQGKGYLSDVIEGLDWAVANGIQVVNMSFGSSSSSDAFREAISRAYQAGLVMVAAAGNNNGGAVSYPAAYPEVIAVSATDSNDNLASFSSTGPEVDLAAPGVSIFSTYKNLSYATLSGTSMAAPHVTGAAVAVLATPVRSSYDWNLNGVWDNNEVKAVLQDTADDLGAVGFDPYFGFGLVDVEESVTGNQTSP